MKEEEQYLYGKRSSTPNLEGDVDLGYDNIQVDLVQWPEDPYNLVWQATMTSWRTDIPIELTPEQQEWETIQVEDPVDHVVRSDRIRKGQKHLVLAVLEDRMLPNILESLEFTFMVRGVTRVATHQIVRARQGVVFNQFSTRFVDVKSTKFRMPPELNEEQQTEFKVVADQCRRLYEKWVKEGIHEQLARYILPDSLETSITSSWNFMALRSMTRQRSCHTMQPEHVDVVFKMIHAVRDHYPLLAKYMYSSCYLGRCFITPENIEWLQLPYDKDAPDGMCSCKGWLSVRNAVLDRMKELNQKENPNVKK